MRRYKPRFASASRSEQRTDKQDASHGGAIYMAAKKAKKSTKKKGAKKAKKRK
jgi:hypothetical protein